MYHVGEFLASKQPLILTVLWLEMNNFPIVLVNRTSHHYNTQQDQIRPSSLYEQIAIWAIQIKIIIFTRVMVIFGVFY